MNYEHFIAGCFGGFIGTSLSHPLDTIRIKTQSNRYNIYQNTNDIFIRNGPIGFYKGFFPPLISISLEKAIVFGVYNNCYNKKIFKNNNTNILFSGYMSGVAASFFVTPLEAVKIHQQNMVEGYPFIKCFRNLILNGRLYSSFIPTLFREPPGFAIYFSTYNYLNQILPSNNIYNTFLYGSLSGCISWIFIYPADVIKTRLQVSNDNLISIIKDSIKKKNLYKGFSLSIMRAIPLHGGAFVGYEYIKNNIFKNNKNIYYNA